MDNLFKRLKKIFNNTDFFLVSMPLLFLGIMIIPIHPFLLDLFFAFVLSVSILILLVSLYIKRPLDFSTFPSILLILTLFRLALNVASTRNILLKGGEQGVSAAGEIIRAFGEFVVGGNTIVGIIIFIILVVINFVVITKGAGRVAEVSARFTLDAMPGKQMAIDADLNSGLINEQQAKKRREEIAQEADFYGSMDGSSKFVRGDAVAGILITMINIIGGIIVGVFQQNLDIAQASEIYTLLTVGDGLVGQIPALIISTAAGIIVTRNTADQNLGNQVSDQFKIHPKALYLVSGVMGLFVLVPGIPKIPFLLLSIGTGLLANYVEKKNIADEKKIGLKKDEDQKRKKEGLEDLLGVETIELEVGYGLINLVDSEQKGDLLERISQIRKQFVLDWGVIIPAIRIKDNLELRPGGYVLKLKGIVIGQGDLMVDYLLAMDPGQVIETIKGVPTKEPVFGLPAIWISENQKEDAQYYGYTVVDLATIMATHITEVIKNNLSEILGRDELSGLLDNLKIDNPKVVQDLIPEIVSFGIVLKVLKNLLKEGISIRDLKTILETLAEHGDKNKDEIYLTEQVRYSLYRSISESLKNEQGEIPVYALDENIEELISSNIVQTDSGPRVNISHDVLQKILHSLHEKIEEATDMGERFIVLCSPLIRSHFKKLIDRFIPKITIISHNELSPNISVKNLGKVRS